MKEHPILFNGSMVRALLGGSKTQTRRIVKGAEQWPANAVKAVILETRGTAMAVDAQRYTYGPEIKCPHGMPGDRLWVRETFVQGWPCIDGNPDQFEEDGSEKPEHTWYRASKPDLEWDNGEGRVNVRWRPSIFMPRALSRITLEIVSVRVERLQDISEADCCAEGCAGGHGSIPGYGYAATPLEHYNWLWESINGPSSWGANPWVWAIQFKRIIP